MFRKSEHKDYIDYYNSLGFSAFIHLSIYRFTEKS